MIDESGKKIKTKFKEIQAYQRSNDLYVKREAERPYAGREAYMKVVTMGHATLYEFTYRKKSGGGTSYGTGAATSSLVTAVKDYYVSRGEKSKLVTEEDFKKDMVKFFSDTYEIRQKIISKEYVYRDIVKIVMEYNSSYEEGL